MSRLSIFFILSSLSCLLNNATAQVWDSLPLPTSNVSIAVQHNGAIFAANGNQLGLFRSLDLEGNWERVANFPTGKISSITSLDNYLYVTRVVDNGNDITYRSTDNGDTWSLLWETAPSSPGRAYRQDTVFSYIGNGIVVRHVPSGVIDTVFSNNSLTINRLKNIGNELWILRPDEIWHSPDGVQWSLLSTPPPFQTVSGLYYLQQTVFFFGNGKLYRSADLGGTWSQANIPPALQGSVLSITEVDGVLYAGISISANNTHYIRSADAGLTWTLAYKGIPARQWLATGNRWMVRTADIGFLISDDNGATWWDGNHGLPDNYAHGYCRLDNGVRLCSSVQRGVFRSMDDGESWEYVLRGAYGAFATLGNRVALLAYDSLYTSSDNGSTWDVMPYQSAQNKKGKWVDATHLIFGGNGNPDYLCDLVGGNCENMYPVGGVVVSQGKIFGISSLLFQGQHVVMSEDQGQTWVKADSLAPWTDLPYQLFATDSVLVVRTDQGAYYLSQDNGATWRTGGVGLPPETDISYYGYLWRGWGRYIGIVFEYSTTGESYFSDDYGETWTSVYTESPQDVKLTGNASSEGYYYLREFGGLDQTLPGLPISPGRLLRWENFSENAVRGFVFNDLNNNGQQDTGEVGLPNVPVWLRRSGIVAATDANGNFALLPDQNQLPDTLTIQPFASLDGASPAFYSIDGPGSNRNFGLHFDNDVAIVINSGSDPKAGYFQNLVINCQNTGTIPQTGMLKLIPDPLLTYIPPNDTIPAPMVFGDTLVWNLGLLQPFEIQTFQVLVQVDSAAVFGDTLRSVTILCLDMPDVAAANDRDTLVQAVVASFDPNDKWVAEGEHISPAYAVAREDLHYRIRFQNTGNFPAFKVVIRDTLSPLLDAASIRLLGFSHPCQLVLSGTREVEFRFDPIFLPDSISNEAGSHGFVVFSVKPKPGRMLGDVFENKAFIYFDANAPIQTNTVQTTVTEVVNTTLPSRGVSETLRIIPNPVHGDFMTIQLENARSGINTIGIFTLTGQKMLEQRMNGESTVTVPVKNLPPGSYWIEAMGKGIRISRIFVRM